MELKDIDPHSTEEIFLPSRVPVKNFFQVGALQIKGVKTNIFRMKGLLLRKNYRNLQINCFKGLIIIGSPQKIKKIDV